MRGARAAPSPAPGHLGRDQGPRSPGPSLSQLAGSHYPLPCCGNGLESVFQGTALPPGYRACPPPSHRLSWEEGRGLGPNCSFSRKGQNPGPHQHFPGLQPTSRLHTSVFPKRDQLACLLAWGRGDSAGNCWGQGLTSDLRVTSGAGPTAHSGGAVTVPRGLRHLSPLPPPPSRHPDGAPFSPI